ncbi:hypothetical protein C8R43DRAFT_1125598 [Mycena crocata]|nr:hypothetical protein C8R43DRAFT_1125598 [Mycena crocata]
MAKRYVLYPIRQPEQWDLYKAAEANFWTAEDYSISTEILPAQNTLSPATKLALQACIATIIVNHQSCTLEQLCIRTSEPESRTFIGYQAMMRNIHTEAFVNILEHMLESTIEVEKVLVEAELQETYSNWKAHTLQRHSDTVVTRALILICTENIFHSRLRALLPSADSTALPADVEHAILKVGIDIQLTRDFLVKLIQQYADEDTLSTAEKTPDAQDHLANQIKDTVHRIRQLISLSAGRRQLNDELSYATSTDAQPSEPQQIDHRPPDLFKTSLYPAGIPEGRLVDTCLRYPEQQMAIATDFTTSQQTKFAPFMDQFCDEHFIQMAEWKTDTDSFTNKSLREKLDDRVYRDPPTKMAILKDRGRQQNAFQQNQ